jgi:hypothetical protein
VIELLDEPAAQRALAARARIVERFGVDAAVGRYAALYRRLAATPAAP